MTRRCFNTQPPEGGWVDVGDGVDCGVVSTHSRPKAAGSGFRRLLHLDWVSTHSRPKAAGIFDWSYHSVSACFNTQPPEGGWPVAVFAAAALVCFNTQPPEGGWQPSYNLSCILKCFNTQPPEGGWMKSVVLKICRICFNTQPPEGGWFLK